MSANDKAAATFYPGNEPLPTPTLEARVRLEVGRVITNVSNWPDAVAPRLLGRDLSKPIDMVTEALAPLIAEVKAEALREAADTLNAHADRNERDAVKLAFRTKLNLSGTYWAVRRHRTLARWLRARADKLVTE